MTVATAPVEGLIPFQPIWELTIRRDHKFWSFDMPEYGVREELLCGGTEEVIDELFHEHKRAEPLNGDVLKVRLVAIQATITLKAVTPTTLAKLVCQVHFHRFSKNHQAMPYDIIRLTPTPKMPA